MLIGNKLMNQFLLSNLSDISKESTFRIDFRFIEMDKRLTTETYYSFDDLFELVEDDKVNDLSTLGSFYYAEIGNTTAYNQVFPNMLNWNDQNELNAPLFKKIINGDIIRVEKGDILISKVRPYLKKIIYITDEYSAFHFTSAFLHVRPKKHNKIVYYALKSIFILNLMAVTRQGKGYPTISARDLKHLKFKKEHIDNLFEHAPCIENKLAIIEHEIESLTSSMRTVPDITNDVFLKYVCIPHNRIKSDYKRSYYVDLFDINSLDLRSSFRFNNPKYQYLSETNFNHIFSDFIDSENSSLGRQMSPIFVEEYSDVYYINTNSIKLSGFEEAALTPISTDFYCKNSKLKVDKGDILLIASGEGSIGRSCIFDSDADCITSQFIMKLHPKENTDTQFLNFYMHSFYFQYCVEKFKKGKGNMTNIFVSQLLNFPLYYPSQEIRKSIVDEITTAFNDRSRIIQQINELRDKIDELLNENL